MDLGLNILIAAGSPDSIKLIERLLSKGYNVIVVNTSRQIFDSLMKIKGIRIVTSAANASDFVKLIENLDVNILIDETSPFSTIISPVLMEATKIKKIVYCRYEGKRFSVKSENIIYARDHSHCVEILNSRQGKILLTIDSSAFGEYVRITDYVNRLYLKVSPLSDELKKCESLNIPNANIIAFHGGATKDFWIALISHLDVSIIVTDENGPIGGTERRSAAAEESGIPAVLVNTPEIHYINRFRTHEDIIRFIENAAPAIGNSEAL